jgi:RNA polymerase sigma-32 factor
MSQTAAATASSHAFLEKDVEFELARAWQEDRDYAARDKLILAYMPLVNNEAHKIARQTGAKDMYEDLVQEAYEAMLQALDEFDLSRNLRFGTYARWHIESKLRRQVMDMGGPTRIGTNLNDKKVFFQFRSARATFERKKGREYRNSDAAEVAAMIGVPEEAIQRMSARLHRQDISLDISYTCGDVDDDSQDHSISSYLHADGPTPEEAAIARHDGAAVRRVIEGLLEELPERFRVVLENRLLRNDPASLARLGKQLRLSKKHVKEIQDHALKTLRDMMAARGLSAADLIDG